MGSLQPQQEPVWTKKKYVVTTGDNKRYEEFDSLEAAIGSYYQLNSRDLYIMEVRYLTDQSLRG